MVHLVTSTLLMCFAIVSLNPLSAEFNLSSDICRMHWAINWSNTIVLSRVLYAAPAWRGYLSAGEVANLQQLFAKAKRWNIEASNYDIDVVYYWIILIKHFLDHLCIKHTICIICFQVKVITRMQ